MDIIENVNRLEDYLINESEISLVDIQKISTYLTNIREAAINYTHSCKSDSELLLFSADEIVSKINEQTVLDGETFRVYFREK